MIYNDIEPYCCQWLRNLIAAGHLPEGDVIEGDFREIVADDIPETAHWFAGIGGWPYALELAGWQGPVWTASLPCQPFSSARRGRTNRDTDLWPEWFRFVAAKRPGTIFGEQVPNGFWFDRLCDDMETLDYQVGAAVLPAVLVGEDHERERLFFVCHANGNGKPSGAVNGKTPRLPKSRGFAGNMAAKDGVSNRMAQLRAYGNAIVPQVAAEFVKAVMECEG